MTTFSQLQDDVFTITNRPDLTAETALAIRAATFKLHLLEYWEEDRVETSVAVTQTDGIYQIDVSEDISPLVRRIEYIQKAADYSFLSRISPVDVFDEYGNMKNNVWYRVGQNINCRSNTSDTSVLIGYVKAPVTSSDSYSSWIADVYPHLVAVEAAITVLNAIGETDIVKRLQSMAAEGIAILKINHLPRD